MFRDERDRTLFGRDLFVGECAMLMIGTAEFAERLYEAWRQRQDFVAPLSEETTWRSGRSRSTRPPWRMLTTIQQDVWKHVADAAGRAVADAMDVASA